jgi:putative nucleotidyltransferase with HDIG domain
MEKASKMITARKLMRDVSDLPAIPGIVATVISLLEAPDSNPDKVADLILSDQVLAARVLRVVNSPLFRGGNKITSVKHALMHIGFKAIREMILTKYFVDAFKDREQPFDIKTFWLHSFNVGAVSRRIAGMAGYHDLEKAYLAGIVHDIGKVFMGHYLRKEYGEMLAGINGTPCRAHDAEQEFFGTSHCEVGLCLAQRWNFPPDYCDTISYHHTSKLATEDPMLTAIVNLSDFFCLTHDPVTGEANELAGPPNSSEEHAWLVLKQRSNRALEQDLSSFFATLSDEYAEIAREVEQLFQVLTRN